MEADLFDRVCEDIYLKAMGKENILIHGRY